MTSRKPYLIRALYDWIIDNACTPYVLVNCALPDVQVPAQYVQDNKIVLNISAQAVYGLELSNTGIRFSARFSGQSFNVDIPVAAVLAIYARENGEGMMFTDDDKGGDPEPPSPEKPKRPSLKVIK